MYLHLGAAPLSINLTMHLQCAGTQKPMYSPPLTCNELKMEMPVESSGAKQISHRYLLALEQINEPSAEFHWSEIDICFAP